MKIVAIEDELAQGKFLRLMFPGIKVCREIPEAHWELSRYKPDLILTDINVMGQNAISYLLENADNLQDVGVVIVSGCSSKTIQNAYNDLESAGITVVGTIQKPFDKCQTQTILNMWHETPRKLPSRKLSR